ncbi:hypothetical protein ABMA27_016821 [Loxostege sticticalis]|uniref:Reverse transcriptase domain-containing protein n=1 Tax=Loxostege sticticalis TaxID=481309 RepID=A0ABR3I3P5_LOXSC
MWLSLKIQNQNVVVGTAYKPPWQDVDLFLDGITESIAAFAWADGLILTGDFNIDLLKPGSGRARAFAQFINSSNLKQIITEPTHYTDDSSTLIDLMCTDIRVHQVTVKYAPDLSRHCMLLAELNIKKAKPTPRWVTYRPLKDILLQQLNLDLNAIEWDNYKKIANVNHLVEAFTTSIRGLMDLHAPVKSRKFKHPPHPWMTDTIHSMMRIRDTYHKRFRELKTLALFDSYKKMKHSVQEAIEREKKCFFDNNINSQLGNSKKLWKNLKTTVLPNKLTLPFSLGAITAIINRSIADSVFPDSWKVAVVKPLPKTSQPASVGELRPISILPCLSKVLERIVCDQLTGYLEEHNILPDLQSGFRRGHGTATALADVVDNLLTAQDKGMVSMLILLDFSRAFDSINIPLLLSKMRYYGVEDGAIKWFHSYLTNRSQFVEIRSADGTPVQSRAQAVTRGVPQGSILGPILYILYGADIVKNIKHCSYHLYADDLQLYISFEPDDYDLAVRKVNSDLQSIAEWCLSNCLVLNPKKSKLILTGTSRNTSKLRNKSPKIELNGEPIEQVDTVRNLGLVFDSQLRFDGHVSECVRSCFYRLKLLYKIRPYLSEMLRIRLCESLVLSRLNYCDTVYGPCLRGFSVRLVQRVQNACIRFCFNVPPRSHVTPFINDAGQLRMEARMKLHLATMLFDVINSAKPKYLYEKLAWAPARDGHIRRACTYVFSTQIHRTAAFRGSFRFAASRCWNDLPPPLRALKVKNTFKTRLKKYLLTQQRTESANIYTYQRVMRVTNMGVSSQQHNRGG